MKTVNNKYITFIFLPLVLLIFSCGLMSKPINSVPKEQVEKLNNSTDTITFQNKHYKLESYYLSDYYTFGPYMILSHENGKFNFKVSRSELIHRSEIQINIYSDNINTNKLFFENFKIKYFWIISTTENYYYETKDISISDISLYDNRKCYVNVPDNYNPKGKYTIILQLESESGISYIKGQVQ